MRILSISNRGIGRPYRKPEPTTLDLAALGAGLVAIDGPNGAGKSFLLESLPAALYQKLPYREPRSIYEYASGRDAVAEAILEDAGRIIRVTARFDAEKRKCERSLSIDGVSVASGKAAFDAAVLKLTGSYDLFIATVLSSQSKKGNLCEVPVAQRKVLFAELLGLARYGEIHLRAKERREVEERAVAELRRQIAAAEVDLQGIPDAEISLIAAVTEGDAIALLSDGTREAEADTSRKLGLARSAADRIAPLEAALAAAKRELAAAEQALSKAETRPDELHAALAEKLRFIDARRAGEMEPRARERHRAAVDGISQRRAALSAAVAEEPAVTAAAAELEVLAGERAGIEERAKERAALESKVREAKTRLDAATSMLARAIKIREGQVEDLRRRAGLIAEAPCTAYQSWAPADPKTGDTDPAREDLAGTCPLLADARKAREDLAAVESTPAAADETAERDRLQVEHLALTREAVLMQAGTIHHGPRLTEIATRERELKPVAAKASAIAAALEQVGGLGAEAAAADEVLRHELEEAAAAVREAAAAREAAENEQKAALVNAEAETVNARTAAVNAGEREQEARGALQEARSQLGDAGVASAEAALARASQARKTAETALREADQAVATARARLDQLRAREAELAPTRARMAIVETALGDWRLLEEAFGKNGIPQLRIDAAGPEVSALATEILRVSWGTRFAIAIETTRELVTREGAAEAFEIIVWDGGERRTVEDLSGGERVVVHEAISLACAVYNRRKSGIDWKTLFRDETAGALDHDHARQYVPMLRRALELGGFEQLVYVSHNPDVVAAADVVVTVEEGRLTVGATRCLTA